MGKGDKRMNPIATLIVTAPKGLNVRCAPTAVSKVVRSIRVGEAVDCYMLTNIDTVPYGKVSPDKSEWVRIAEADGNTKYCEVIKLNDNGADDIVYVLNRIADILEKK
jgi:hypothetical protein